ncbi:MAG: hypothetical protein C0603_10700 [Denitrovibrio sp.]|nr:MAG: hypothetical protein C0603_10700 [Denitrovibrio sp.]
MKKLLMLFSVILVFSGVLAFQKVGKEVLVNSAAYIPAMCYTKTKDENGAVHNPCYACHTKGVEPNYMDDTALQVDLAFPEYALKNRWKNLFKDRTKQVSNISDKKILQYVQSSNYFDEEHEIILKSSLPIDFAGYVPDCYFNFDSFGFDHGLSGELTGWRAFRYYPFLGTFWPTNGSTDDVLIRLSEKFMKDTDGSFSLEVYKANLAIVEAVVKQKTVPCEGIDERVIKIDLDNDGQLGIARSVDFGWPDKKMKYAGLARDEKLAGGLYPVGTEILHTVRYIDWDEDNNAPKLSARMKEVRYAKKTDWYNYAELKESYVGELKGTYVNGEVPMVRYNGNGDSGLQTGSGWVYQAFIEANDGSLRPQTTEETEFCMGCHSGLGATVDTIFSFHRKLEGIDKHKIDSGWNHWTQKGLKGLPDQIINYRSAGEKREYAFYLENNNAGDEFRGNEQIMKTFFNEDGTLKQGMLDKLEDDISVLLFPTKKRAMQMNKAYRVIVKEQSYIYGRDATVTPPKNVHEELKENADSGVKRAVY